MEIGSHYYAVLALCRLLGLKKDIAYKIAYSSQFVDDALIEKVIFKSTEKGVSYHLLGKHLVLDHCATCPHIMTVWSYNHDRMMRTLVPFHFVPIGQGEDYNRRIRTSPRSLLLRELLEEAINSKNPYHLGIILHVMGDAYAHQGFSGIISRGNRIRKFRINMDTISGRGDRLLANFIAQYPNVHSKTLARILPMYSHSRVGTVPDLPSVEWSYEYDAGIRNVLPRFVSSGIISNPQRYTEAFNKFIEIITKFIKLVPEFKDHQAQDLDKTGFFLQLVKDVSREETESSWKTYIVEQGLFEKDDHELTYNVHAWLKNAFVNYKNSYNARKVMKKAIPVENFAQSDWYQFYLAQREYKTLYDQLLFKYEVI